MGIQKKFYSVSIFKHFMQAQYYTKHDKALRLLSDNSNE